MNLIVDYISIIGSFALAISGALTAMDKKFDPFGVLIIAFVSAVGGGTIRDMLITQRDVFWLTSPSYVYIIIVGAVLAIIFRKKLNYMAKPLLIFDAIGLGLFTITGVQIGIEYELSAINCIILGTITGSFGGVLRDILVNEIPVIFKKEIYATVCILGGILYIALNKTNLPNIYLQVIPIVFIVTARIVVIYKNISLPSLYRDNEK
ncbi:MAG: trimeric intracellular cation channel family protein [Salinivirgaceae bacterium]|nr:trimeric intracellular cation channel family protein [Salinivirgaceae bacterium]